MVGQSLVGRRVLLVEDEMVVSMILEDMLVELGCEVIGPAARVCQALALINAEAIDTAVLDVNLDGEKSYAVADELAAKGVPFVFTTGYDKLLPAYHDFPRLQKPFKIKQMEDKLTDALAEG